MNADIRNAGASGPDEDALAMQEWRVFGHALRLPKKVAKDSVLNQLFIRANQKSAGTKTSW